MAFLIYEEKKINKDNYIVPTGLEFSLAGYNAIFDIWNEKKCPINKGWNISRDELMIYYQKKQNINSQLHLIIDFDPHSKTRIGLIEILDIYIFTEGNSDEKSVAWNPLMFRMQDIFYDEFNNNNFPIDKEKFISQIKYPPSEIKESVEFLYTNGDDKQWKWGSNGRTNATFLQGEVRDYFRQYF